MVANGEQDPLLSPSTAGKYYFLNSGQPGSTDAVRDGDGVEVIEPAPDGTTEDEFAPRVLGIKRNPSQVTRSPRKQSNASAGGGPADSNGGFFGKLFGIKQQKTRPYGEVGTLMKMRKAPVKIEPKVFFANERTFLAWMHLSVILAGASIAILAFAEDENPLGQLYGVVLLPVAIAFILYSMYQYQRRAKMIRHRHPGPYEDTVGPVVLGIMLMISIVAQFALKLYAMSSM